MAKVSKSDSAVLDTAVSSLENQEPVTEQQAFEMLELACGDLSTLTRAFELIAAVCAEDDGTECSEEDRATPASVEFPQECEYIH